MDIKLSLQVNEKDIAERLRAQTINEYEKAIKDRIAEHFCRPHHFNKTGGLGYVHVQEMVDTAFLELIEDKALIAELQRKAKAYFTEYMSEALSEAAKHAARKQAFNAAKDAINELFEKGE